ncbi:frizzled-4 [Musca vetustissima]|uniref:frizzled-4 n=1 Tax=Musca vetustissima TaxID=27455 RepID=UPI002AB7A102|nr:frizzled-4 [Musca vetustissima]
MSNYILCAIILLSTGSHVIAVNEFGTRQCEPIRIDLCRNIGYNETSMPNLAGNEVQSDAEYTLTSFSPLIEYVCSTQLKLFLCATYVPMCTLQTPVPIGPCRSLCESVRSRCDPVLQGFGYLWPPALDCSRFPKQNNQETMCMEGPGESSETLPIGDSLTPVKSPPHQTMTAAIPTLECPGHSKQYVKLPRSWRCAPLCEASILFSANDKHIAEVWTSTWTYVALSLGLLTVLCVLVCDSETKINEAKNTRVLSPLMWCHIMVVIGWTVRFVAGRNATACGYDPQLPNVSLLLVDGLSNGPCAATFLLRYYFGMAATAWWAILSLGWHRDVRRNSPDTINQISLDGNAYTNHNGGNSKMKTYRANSNKADDSIITSNLARFLAWGLPAFQTAAVIVARIIDADELLGACFVGNQSDKGLQILVATPLFCYWIFGSMNLASGFLVHRRNKDIANESNSTHLRLLIQYKYSISGSFLFMYCVPCVLLLLAVIYEFANIDVWLSLSNINEATPMWPFMTRAFMELLLAIIAFSWILVPKLSLMYKGHMIKSNKTKIVGVPPIHNSIHTTNNISCRSSGKTYSTVSYQSVRQSKNTNQQHQSSAILLKHPPYSSIGRGKSIQKSSVHTPINSPVKKTSHAFQLFNDETIL